MQDHADSGLVTVLVGNKCDLKHQREVDYQKGE